MSDSEGGHPDRQVRRMSGLVPHASSAEMPAKYTQAVLRRHKREGMELAVRARWLALAVIAVFMVFVIPHWQVLFYHGILALLALNGWLIRRVGRVGQSRAELTLIFADLAILTLGIVLPNPLADDSLPLAMHYRYGNFIYFFVLLAAGTLAFSWRTVIAIGTWTAAMWILAMTAVWWLAPIYPDLTLAVQRAFVGASPDLVAALDPNSIEMRIRIQEVVVFLIVAVTLAFSSRRFDQLLVENAALERARANLSRYFSPNVVEDLSRNDEPL